MGNVKMANFEKKTTTTWEKQNDPVTRFLFRDVPVKWLLVFRSILSPNNND